jgi:hypothetical protein
LPSPFGLTDTNLNTDLLTAMEALSALQAETPYRVFSVHIFNDRKRLEGLKNQLASLARFCNPEWKRLPAAQTSSLQTVGIHADAVLSIENLTTFHEFVRKRRTCHPVAKQSGRNTNYATNCTYGNPSPATRRLLRLIPDETPIFHWSDLDYGGFNILSQLRRLVSDHIRPYRMDIATLLPCGQIGNRLVWL